MSSNKLKDYDDTSPPTKRRKKQVPDKPIVIDEVSMKNASYLKSLMDMCTFDFGTKQQEAMRGCISTYARYAPFRHELTSFIHSTDYYGPSQKSVQAFTALIQHEVDCSKLKGAFEGEVV